MQNDSLTADTNKERTKRRGRWMLLLLFVFFALPLLLVVAMHKYDWHPQGNSRGELISPPRLLRMPPQLLDAHGAAVKQELWHDKWSMVYIANDCQQACNERLYTMRQLHASLAKDIGRVQRVLLTPSSSLDGIQQQYPDLIILNQPAAELAILRQQFDLPGVPSGSEDRVYLVDPLGNLMMSYPANVAVADIRKDLIRLLAYAWAG